MSFNITPVANGYQEIHPYSAMNIDSVKINTSLIMMKECLIHIGFFNDLFRTKLGMRWFFRHTHGAHQNHSGHQAHKVHQTHGTHGANGAPDFFESAI